MRSSRGLRITSILVALPVALFFISLFVILCIGTLGQVKKWLNPIVPIFTVLESVLIPITYVFGIVTFVVAISWLVKANPSAIHKTKLIVVQCWELLWESIAKPDKATRINSIALDLDVSLSDTDTAQARTQKKSTSISTKLSTPLSQPRQRQLPATVKPASKKTSSPSKLLLTQSTAAGAEVPKTTENDSKAFCKFIEPDSSDIEDKTIKATHHQTDDHFISKPSVENLQTKDSSAFSAQKTNAVPEVKQVDLAEIDDDFITAEKRKRRRTRGGAKAQRQKQAQTEQSSTGTDHVPKTQVKKSHDGHSTHKVHEKESANAHRVHPPTPTHALEPRRKLQTTHNHRYSGHEENAHEEGRTTPKSSPRLSNANVTYANVTANASNNNSPVADESSPPVTFAPQPPVSPSPSHSSKVVSDNEKRQSWYSPFSSGLELDIVPRPQPSTSSESVPFNRLSPTMDTSPINYQHPEVLDALFRGSRHSHLEANAGLGLTYAVNGDQGLNAGDRQPLPARWDMFNHGRAPIGPPGGFPRRMASNLKAVSDWDQLPDIDEPPIRNPRHSCGVIGSHERETWQEQPNVDQGDRKNSKVGFSFFDRRLSSFSPRR